MIENSKHPSGVPPGTFVDLSVPAKWERIVRVPDGSKENVEIKMVVNTISGSMAAFISNIGKSHGQPA